MTRHALWIAACAVSACSPTHESERARTPTVEAWMHRLIAPTRPCIERFRGRVPDPYFAQVRLTAADAHISLAFESGQAPEFNACVVDAVTAARLPARGLDGSVVVPFAFTFAVPARG